MTAGAGRFQIHYVRMSDDQVIAKGGLREIPRVGDHVKIINQYLLETGFSSYLNQELHVKKVVWWVAEPTSLVRVYVEMP